MFDPKTYALNLLMRNPRFKNNDLAQNFIRVLQTGNEQEGIQMANNILKSHGLSREEGMQQAKNGFKMK